MQTLQTGFRTRTIPLEERIEDIGKRIAAGEPDLLLAWAVEAASRLIRQRNYAIVQSCHEELLEWALAEGYKHEKLPAINGFVQRVQARVAGIRHKRTNSGRFSVGLMVTYQ